jgi:hypothetical protein
LLDKIKAAFAGFEYYFDLNGDFIFRKKRGYIELAAEENNDNLNAIELAYEFTDAKMLTSLSLTPSLTEFKNDYVVWGLKKTTNGIERDILMHYAFDNKPTEYYAFWGSITYEELFSARTKAGMRTYLNLATISPSLKLLLKHHSTTDYDWREVLYQMACDSNYFSSVED